MTLDKCCDSVLKPDSEIKSDINWSYSASKKDKKIIILKIKNPSYLNIFSVISVPQEHLVDSATFTFSIYKSEQT